MPLEEPDPIGRAGQHRTARPGGVTATGVQLLDEDEITGDEEFQNFLHCSATATSRLRKKRDEADSISTRTPGEGVRRFPSSERALNLPAMDMFDAFLDGLQISSGGTASIGRSAEVMQNAGEVLREFVDGMEQTAREPRAAKDGISAGPDNGSAPPQQSAEAVAEHR